MPFNSLLLTGLVPEGKIHANGVGATLVPSEQAEGENMLLFQADHSDFHEVYLRPPNQQKESTSSCCDLVCFAYKLQKGNDGKDKRRITICLIELKGGKTDQTKKAGEQILRTRQEIVKGLYKSKIEEWKKIKKENIIWKALVISDAALSNTTETTIDEELAGLRKIFNGEAYHFRGNINLTKFMQGYPIKSCTLQAGCRTESQNRRRKKIAGAKSR